MDQNGAPTWAGQGQGERGRQAEISWYLLGSMNVPVQIKNVNWRKQVGMERFRIHRG